MRDHSESLEVDFDASKISFAHFVDLFWDAHNPSSVGWGVQYAHKIWHRTPEEKQIIDDSKKKWEAVNRKQVLTKVEPFTSFTLAEDYHQKYTLRRHKNIIQLMKFSDKDIIDSLYAARLNSWLAGRGDLKQLEEIDSWNVSQDVKEKVKSECEKVLTGSSGKRRVFCV